MVLFEKIEESVIINPLKSDRKNDVIREMIGVLKQTGKISDSRAAEKAVLAREELSSTGLGSGIAVPHAKIPGITGLTVAVGLAPDGVDFDALDGQPSTIFFLILAAVDQTGPHLEALTDIARISRDQEFCETILRAGSAAEVVRLFKSLE